MPHWALEAWGAIGTTILFLAITCWWLMQDHSIPAFDAGLHLHLAFNIHEDLAAGHLGRALTRSYPYPPFSYLVGSLGILVGGVSVASPIVAENLVFVPLLALGCYHVGRLTFGRTAGLLAVVFALGAPIYIAQFHVFMTDAPETAMVAVSLWAIIASEGFSRLPVCALAGLAVGLGMMTKEPFPFFVAGAIAVTAIRGGFGSWRGLLIFSIVTIAIALPWYVQELRGVEALGTGAAHTVDTASSGSSPPRFSVGNLTWYLWVLINDQLYLPLFLFAAVGWVWTIIGFTRRRPVGHLVPELAIGAFVGWLAITETFAHDTRYSMPLLVYLAVFGAGWLTRLPRRVRIASTMALVAIAGANTLGISFGVGDEVTLPLISPTGVVHDPGEAKVYADSGFLVGAPLRDGDILSTMRSLRRRGIEVVLLSNRSLGESNFSAAGLEVLGMVAGLKVELWNGRPPSAPHIKYVTFFHFPLQGVNVPPCLKLGDGTGVWIRTGNPKGPHTRNFCPSS